MKAYKGKCKKKDGSDRTMVLILIGKLLSVKHLNFTLQWFYLVLKWIWKWLEKYTDSKSGRKRDK